MDRLLLKQSLQGACLLILLLSLGSCQKDANPFEKGREQKELNELKDEMLKMSARPSCENSADWKFVTLKEGACGEPVYIPYSVKDNETFFLDKAALFNKKQKAFNAAYNKNQLCTNIGYVPPKRIECVDGKPKFIYYN